MTVRATISGVKLEASGGELNLEGDAALIDEFRAFLQPGNLGLYNPRRGGPYMGVDPSDEVQILDALRWLKDRGMAVTISEVSIPELEKPGGEYGFVDTRDDGAIRQALRPEDVESLEPEDVAGEEAEA